MTKDKINKILNEMQKAAHAVAEENGFKVGKCHISYDDVEFTFKMNALFTEDKNGNEIDADRVKFETYCEMFGLSPEDYGKKVFFIGENRAYKLVGVNPKARKNSIIIQREDNNERYVCSPHYLRDEDGNGLIR